MEELIRIKGAIKVTPEQRGTSLLSKGKNHSMNQRVRR